MEAELKKFALGLGLLAAGLFLMLTLSVSAQRGDIGNWTVALGLLPVVGGIILMISSR